MRKILVITHDAGLNGAPMTLLRLMKLLRNRGYRFNMIARQGGPLEEDFRRLCDIFEIPARKRAKKFIARQIDKFKIARDDFDIARCLAGVGLVLSNTVTNGEILKLIRAKSDLPIISYIHELQMGSLLYTTDQHIRSTIQFTNLFLTSCEAVKKHLSSSFGIPEEKISKLNYYLPALPTPGNDEVPDFRNQYRLGNRFTVAALAMNDWRKGADIFLLVAAGVFKKDPGADIQFIWMGGARESLETKKMLHDINKLDLEGKIIVIESIKNYTPIYQCIDILLLTSREDPFPLVVLEAASKKIPTICFEKAGGAPEFVCPDAGAVVPYLDIEAMADAILSYYNNEQAVAIHGEKAFKKVKRLHQDHEFIYEQFKGSLRNIFS
jgi:glycosyltransferase involved in cell wall biosynthesis